MKKTKPGRKASRVVGMALLLLLSDGPLAGWAGEGDGSTKGSSARAALAIDLKEEDVVELIKKAENLQKSGNEAYSARIWERLLEWAERNKTPNHPSITTSLYKLANLYLNLGIYNKAEMLYIRLLKITEQSSGAKHPDTATSLSSLAWLYFKQGAYSKAEPLYLRGLKINEKALGHDHPSTITSLNILGILYSSQRSYDKAEKLFLRALKTNKKGLGDERHYMNMALSLNNLAKLYLEQANYTKAEELYQRLLETTQDHLGIDHPDTANSLNGLAEAYIKQGIYKKAEPLLLRSLKIREKALGTDHPSTASSLNNLAILFSKQGAYSKAELFLLSALKITEKTLGKDHPTSATSLTNLAGLYLDQGVYSKAEPLLLRSLKIREKALGVDHPDSTASLLGVARFYFIQGAYDKAESFYLRSLKIMEKSLGTDHPDIATSLNGLARLYTEQGEYHKAEPIHLRSLKIMEKTLGPFHPDIASSINDLGDLYTRQGAYSKAEIHFLRSLKINEKALGPDHPHTATSLNNLAILHSKQRAYTKAELFYVRAQKATEKALGPDHPSYATILNNLAALYHEQGADSKVEHLFNLALRIREKVLGPDHIDTANSFSNLGVLYSKQGAYHKAEPLLRNALMISEKALGPDHPTTARNLNNLAGVHIYQGAYSKANLLLRRGLTTEINLIQREAPYLGLIDREAFVDSFGYAYETSYTWTRREGDGSDLALFARLNRQGLLQEIEQRQALLASLPGPQHSVAEELRALTRQLASASISPEKRQTLRERQEELEKQLYRLLPQLRPRIVQVEQVAAALPAGAALVEFQRYRPFDGKKPRKERWEDPRYLALVLRPTGAITAVDLGPAAPIDSLIHQALTATREGLSDAEPLWAQVGHKVMEPLAPAMAGVQSLFISPDGELNRVPFAALPAPGSRTLLGQAMQLRLLTTGRELLDLAQPTGKAQSTALVVANPAFGQLPRNGAAPAQAQERSSDLQGPPFAPLPATDQEGQAISILTRGKLLSGTQATAAAVQSAPTPQILHIASHAFFRPDLPEQTPAADGLMGKRPPVAESPMLRSGIALAGANRNPLPGMASSSASSGEDSDDDGYLTALEVAQLNWKGTELVVISACESGTGETRAGEGLYGLRRAIAVAGARSSLLSLWKVSDDATAAFMEAYYRRLKAGEGRAAALAATQENFRSHPNPTWRHPYVWAAFQLSGDWGPIRGL